MTLTLIFTSAPRSSRAATTSRWPARAGIRGTSPLRRDWIGSARASSNHRCPAVRSRQQWGDAEVVAASMRTGSQEQCRLPTSSQCAAQWSAVAPSACGTVTSAPEATRARRPARSCRLARSTSRSPCAATALDNPTLRIRAIAAGNLVSGCINIGRIRSRNALPEGIILRHSPDGR